MSRATAAGPDWPVISGHAARRFHERKQPCEPSVGPRAAWIEGVPVRGHGCDADAVRYHEPTGLALLAKRSVIVTVLAVDDAADPALREAVAAVGGGSA